MRMNATRPPKPVITVSTLVPSRLALDHVVTELRPVHFALTMQRDASKKAETSDKGLDTGAIHVGALDNAGLLLRPVHLGGRVRLGPAWQCKARHLRRLPAQPPAMATIPMRTCPIQWHGLDF